MILLGLTNCFPRSEALLIEQGASPWKNPEVGHGKHVYLSSELTVLLFTCSDIVCPVRHILQDWLALITSQYFESH